MLTPANFLTILRVVFSLCLFTADAFSPHFFGLYALGGLTDMLDGPIARKTHSETESGAILDSIADAVFLFAVLFKIAPAVCLNKWIWGWILGILILKLVNILLGASKRKELILPHTATNKLTGCLLFFSVFVIKHIDTNLIAVPLCLTATFAAGQETYMIFKH